MLPSWKKTKNNNSTQMLSNSLAIGQSEQSPDLTVHDLARNQDQSAEDRVARALDCPQQQGQHANADHKDGGVDVDRADAKPRIVAIAKPTHVKRTHRSQNYGTERPTRCLADCLCAFLPKIDGITTVGRSAYDGRHRGKHHHTAQHLEQV